MAADGIHGGVMPSAGKREGGVEPARKHQI